MVNVADRLCRMDLNDLVMRPPDMLLRSAKRVLESQEKFEEECYGSLPQSVYDHYSSTFHCALLKLSVALEDHVRSKRIHDEYARYVAGLYTEDEKRALVEFEKFSKLDPSITPPETLADVIVSEAGEVYKLVREAVRKQYVDFKGLVETWSKNLRIRNYVAKALMLRYESRFRNIVEAVKRLLDQQPAWLGRIFKDYEDAL